MAISNQSVASTAIGGGAHRLREAPRYRHAARVQLLDDASGVVTHLDTLDVSLGGAFVVSPVLLEEGTRLKLRVELDAGEPVSVEAEVVRVGLGSRDEEQVGMGIRFTSFPEAEARRWIHGARCRRG
jgi:hypothetical protein